MNFRGPVEFLQAGGSPGVEDGWLTSDLIGYAG